ncbi:MAG: hypothetical protein AAF266_14380 [Planctomycetota bacterium]
MAKWLLKAVVLVVMGVAAFYALQLGDHFLMAQLEGTAETGPIEVIELPESVQQAPKTRGEGPGNALLKRAILTLKQRGSVQTSIEQVGWIDDDLIQTRGDYYQAGNGSERKFHFRQRGELAGSPTDLLQVSDSRFLWSDLAWLDADSETQRRVTRVDLRRVRGLMNSTDEDGFANTGGSDPFQWSRFGGLPMLLAGLDEAFRFGAPRRMQVRDETVAAMVGRWRPDRLDQLAEGETLPPRFPQHVVVALSEATLFPVLVEYRDTRDPLSADGLADEALLTPSRRPLMKIDLRNATFGQRYDPGLFAYRPSIDDWSDQTDRELRLVRATQVVAR